MSEMISEGSPEIYCLSNRIETKGLFDLGAAEPDEAEGLNYQ